jgi:hypothetical protein
MEAARSAESINFSGNERRPLREMAAAKHRDLKVAGVENRKVWNRQTKPMGQLTGNQLRRKAHIARRVTQPLQVTVANVSCHPRYASAGLKGFYDPSYDVRLPIRSAE